MVSVWNLADDGSYVIGIFSADKTLPRSDRITDIAFNPVKAILSAGTMSGRVVMWRRVVVKVGADVHVARNGCFCR